MRRTLLFLSLGAFALAGCAVPELPDGPPVTTTTEAPDEVHCLALGCPGNPADPHQP